jgi:hypothetical protein
MLGDGRSASQVVILPMLDVLESHTQPVSLSPGRRAGEPTVAAVYRIYGSICFIDLWNDLPIRRLMIGTLTAFQWLIHDSGKLSVGVSPLHPNYLTVLLT